MTTYELKPCPFCGVMPHIYWEAWKDISPDAGVWKLEANHKDSCYITHINGTNISGRSSARRLSQLVEWWNHREELFGNSEQLESGHEKDHVADPGKMVGDLISRQAAISHVDDVPYIKDHPTVGLLWKAWIESLPSAQPDIIQCRNCKFASGDSRICMKFGHSPIGELDFCAWAERRTDE